MDIADSKAQELNSLPPIPNEIFKTVDCIIEAELGHKRPDRLRGLALSGGGIRSASFATGVIQAIVADLAGPTKENKTLGKYYHYMSTVSGGGYLGSAITWLQHLNRDLPDELDGLNAGYRNRENKNWLDYVRQHGDYLQPKEVGLLSLISVVLRNMFVALFVYFCAAVLLFYGALASDVLPEKLADISDNLFSIPGFASILAALYFFLLLMYPGATYIGSFPPFTFKEGSRSMAQAVLGVLWIVTYCSLGAALFEIEDIQTFASALSLASSPPELSIINVAIVVYIVALITSFAALRYVIKNGSKSSNIPRENYLARLKLQQHAGWLLGLLITTAVISLFPIAHELIADTKSLNQSEYLTNNANSIGVSGVLTTLGIVGGIYQFILGRSSSPASTASSKTRILLTAALLILGVLFGAYTTSLVFKAEIQEHFWKLLLGIAFLGLFANLNYFGIARMYRDRLMETFMPGNTTIERSEWQAATDADGTNFSVLAKIRPFHLVNTNLVLVDSEKDFFRGRGGDSFIITPKFSGSDATGYAETSNWLNGRMNLPTAIAISGAAVNPNSGVAGVGITRNRLVSFLLSLLQLRIGYWAPNIRFTIDSQMPKQTIGVRLSRFLVRVFRPNYWFPGIKQGLFGRGLKEDATWIELTDGGHFENTGVYELIRREVDEIVLTMASADVGFERADLANLVRKARVDFGAHILFKKSDLRATLPQGNQATARRGFAVGKIKYRSKRTGSILVFFATPIEGMTAELESYRQQHPDFPNEPTSDQSYDETQLEAYRELGFLTTLEYLGSGLTRKLHENPSLNA